MNKNAYCLFLLSIFLPFACYGSGQNQIDWLSFQQNQSTGLVDSYEADGTNRAYLYDQALAIIVFTAAGEYSKAASIIEVLQNLQQSNGVWYECYDANTFTTPATLIKYNTGYHILDSLCIKLLWICNIGLELCTSSTSRTWLAAEYENNRSLRRKIRCRPILWRSWLCLSAGSKHRTQRWCIFSFLLARRSRQ